MLGIKVIPAESACCLFSLQVCRRICAWQVCICLCSRWHFNRCGLSVLYPPISLCSLCLFLFIFSQRLSISTSTFSQFLRTPWAGSNFNCSIKTIKRWLITKVFSFSASSLTCFPFPLPTCVSAWRMRSLRLRVITSLSSLTMSGPSVYSLQFLYPSPCGLFMLRIRSLFISLHVARAPLNKAVLFSSCCSCVFSWGLSLSSFPHINNPHGVLLHK